MAYCGQIEISVLNHHKNQVYTSNGVISEGDARGLIWTSNRYSADGRSWSLNFGQSAGRLYNGAISVGAPLRGVLPI